MIKPKKVSEIRLKIIKLALLQLDKKYTWGKRGPDEFDCSGLTWYIYNYLFDYDINESGIGRSTTTKQMTSGIGTLKIIDENCDVLEKSKFIDEVNEGDILFFHRQSKECNAPSDDNCYPGHCGIYLGDKKFIHSKRKSGRVLISDFNSTGYWKKVLVGSKDIMSHKK